MSGETFQYNLLVPEGTQTVLLRETKAIGVDRLLPEGAEKGALPRAELDFYRREYERLEAALEAAHESSSLAEKPSGKRALNDLLIRLRMRDFDGR